MNRSDLHQIHRDQPRSKGHTAASTGKTPSGREKQPISAHSQPNTPSQEFSGNQLMPTRQTPSNSSSSTSKQPHKQPACSPLNEPLRYDESPTPPRQSTRKGTDNSEEKLWKEFLKDEYLQDPPPTPKPKYNMAKYLAETVTKKSPASPIEKKVVERGNELAALFAQAESGKDEGKKKRSREEQERGELLEYTRFGSRDVESRSLLSEMEIRSAKESKEEERGRKRGRDEFRYRPYSPPPQHATRTFTPRSRKAGLRGRIRQILPYRETALTPVKQKFWEHYHPEDYHCERNTSDYRRYPYEPPTSVFGRFCQHVEERQTYMDRRAVQLPEKLRQRSRARRHRSPLPHGKPPTPLRNGFISPKSRSPPRRDSVGSWYREQDYQLRRERTRSPPRSRERNLAYRKHQSPMRNRDRSVPGYQHRRDFYSEEYESANSGHYSASDRREYEGLRGRRPSRSRKRVCYSKNQQSEQTNTGKRSDYASISRERLCNTDIPRYPQRDKNDYLMETRSEKRRRKHRRRRSNIRRFEQDNQEEISFEAIGPDRNHTEILPTAFRNDAGIQLETFEAAKKESTIRHDRSYDYSFEVERTRTYASEVSTRAVSKELPQQEDCFRVFRGLKRRSASVRDSFCHEENRELKQGYTNFHSKTNRPPFEPNRSYRLPLTGSNTTRSETTRILPALDAISPPSLDKRRAYNSSRPEPIPAPIILHQYEFSLISSLLRTLNAKAAEAIHYFRPHLSHIPIEQESIEMENLDFCFIHIKNALRRIVAKRWIVRGAPDTKDRDLVELDEGGLQELMEFADELIAIARHGGPDEEGWRGVRRHIEGVVDKVNEGKRKILGERMD